MFETWPEFFTHHRHARTLAWAVNALLAALLIVVIVRLVLVLFTWFLAQPPATSSLIAPQPPRTSSANVSSLHLFGQVTAAAPVSSAANASFELRGIFAGNDPARGQAILKDADAVEAVYRVGDLLSDGSKISAIYPDRVELESAGVKSVLVLPKSGLNTQTENSATEVVDTNAVNRAAAMNEPEPPIQTFINTKINTNPVVFDAVKDQAVLNAAPTGNGQNQSALNAIQPVLENGQFSGVRVNGLDADWLKRAGLGADDVLVGVNGQTITSLTQAQNIALSLASAGQATITVRRAAANGKPAQTETITIRKP